MPVRPQFGEQVQQAPQPRLNAQSLARAAPAEQKQMLGEALYPLIHEYVSCLRVDDVANEQNPARLVGQDHRYAS